MSDERISLAPLYIANIQIHMLNQNEYKNDIIHASCTLSTLLLSVTCPGTRHTENVGAKIDAADR